MRHLLVRSRVEDVREDSDELQWGWIKSRASTGECHHQPGARWTTMAANVSPTPGWSEWMTHSRKAQRGSNIHSTRHPPARRPTRAKWCASRYKPSCSGAGWSGASLCNAIGRDTHIPQNKQPGEARRLGRAVNAVEFWSSQSIEG